MSGVEDFSGFESNLIDSMLEVEMTEEDGEVKISQNDDFTPTNDKDLPPVPRFDLQSETISYKPPYGNSLLPVKQTSILKSNALMPSTSYPLPAVQSSPMIVINSNMLKGNKIPIKSGIIGNAASSISAQHAIIPKSIISKPAGANEMATQMINNFISEVFKPEMVKKVFTIKEDFLDVSTFGEEEEAFYKMVFQDVSKVQLCRLHCTICDKHLGCGKGIEKKISVHNMLKVLTCNMCCDFYGDGNFPCDEGDHCEIYCRWCGQGGALICCSFCPKVFCKRCIRRNYNQSYVRAVEKSSDWACFICAQKPLWPHRAVCRALMEYMNIKNADTKAPAKDTSMCCKMQLANKKIISEVDKNKVLLTGGQTIQIKAKDNGNIPQGANGKNRVPANINKSASATGPLIVKNYSTALKMNSQTKSPVAVMNNPNIIPITPKTVSVSSFTKPLLPNMMSTATLPKATSTVTLGKAISTATLPKATSTVTLGKAISTVTVPKATSTVTLGKAISTVTVPKATCTVTLGKAISTATLPKATCTVTLGKAISTATLPKATSTVTLGKAISTVTVPKATSTVTLGKGISTVTVPKGISAVPAPKVINAVTVTKGISAVSVPKVINAVTVAKGISAVSVPKGISAVPAPKAMSAVPAPKQLNITSAPKLMNAASVPKIISAASVSKAINAAIAPKPINVVPPSKSINPVTAPKLTSGVIPCIINSPIYHGQTLITPPRNNSAQNRPIIPPEIPPPETNESSVRIVVTDSADVDVNDIPVAEIPPAFQGVVLKLNYPNNKVQLVRLVRGRDPNEERDPNPVPKPEDDLQSDFLEKTLKDSFKLTKMMFGRLSKIKTRLNMKRKANKDRLYDTSVKKLKFIYKKSRSLMKKFDKNLGDRYSDWKKQTNESSTIRVIDVSDDEGNSSGNQNNSESAEKSNVSSQNEEPEIEEVIINDGDEEQNLGGHQLLEGNEEQGDGVKELDADGKRKKIDDDNSSKKMKIAEDEDGGMEMLERDPLASSDTEQELNTDA